MGKKILVVDDDNALLLLLSRRLSQAGHQILTALDASQAVRQATREIPDLILLDIKLPAGGGTGVLKTLKSSSRTMQIPVIVMTASEDPALRGEVEAFGPEDFLIKPLDIDGLIKKIGDSTPGCDPDPH
jgi:CheY-like chemotaxis protein